MSEVEPRRKEGDLGRLEKENGGVLLPGATKPRLKVLTRRT